ncbi:zinc finger CCHC domain-containing protein 17 isoform X1 [Ahaetulla prasina]|uniref:zinc finger CCHC domain-containing protein 17 isoform X1 n=2 Tax=Ahaetulla prasina TaxID=499056 RepID=UPI002649CCCF|nr:zinc finger CCHC domain-containing protein 17 isoform X1 [Ahaetulla prasina]XP_058051285.1 zinc finger CCHC domain-containing protein 17 isoform X1 [Ahaetulla prasina]
MDQLPELYAVFQGEVASVTEYGAFIKIPGTQKQGLVHKSQMSNCRVDKPSEMVDVGEKVWVKLIRKEKTDDKLKLSLSMKVVNQGTGKDLDPNNVVLDQEARKKCSFRDYTSQKITLEAVLNTVCKKCGCPGHFAKDCFMQPGGTKYTLIPEDEPVPAEDEKKAHHSMKKRKKDKKKKRKRKNTDLEASDSTNSDNGNQPAQKKAKRKEKNSPSRKRKKKHHKKKHKE